MLRNLVNINIGTMIYWANPQGRFNRVDDGHLRSNEPWSEQMFNTMGHDPRRRGPKDHCYSIRKVSSMTRSLT